MFSVKLFFKIVMKKIIDFSKLRTCLCIFFMASFLGMALFACTNKRKQYVEQWYGKTIQFPDSLTFRLYAKDKQFFDYWRGQYKILVILGNAECVSCKLRIDDWQRFIKDMNTTGIDLNYIFIMNSLYKRELYAILKSNDFSLPVCIDHDKDIRLLNDIPFNSSHVFLLDCQNRIVCVGNPITNIRIRDLYKYILNNR